jgi:hypothetical protein
MQEAHIEAALSNIDLAGAFEF